MSDMGPVELPWSYWDGAVEVELRAHEYPYGAGSVGSGVQISLSSRHTGQVIAVRLPGNSAMRLALAILGATTPHPPPAVAPTVYAVIEDTYVGLDGTSTEFADTLDEAVAQAVRLNSLAEEANVPNGYRVFELREIQGQP